ncbi:LicD family protein [Listeria kieliensis]|uniref:LicD/FKTN/FKRP nucleotidyltransferase domain-containing protein n=1 Tax=Listeria kieliensis TaxID=1621700 RepID=A0A3D8TRB8_9LIST|nr:LicD family protein [Listeria kieliensis]RDX01242.1 hypothetical protein UR08_09955 [Listeria kieliensis]
MQTEQEILERLKQTELSILIEVAELCDKYKLKYYLMGGTLLGAVRHGGFIPWDDDIDIAMPRADFEAFQEIAARELPKSLFLHYGTTDPHYYLPIIKIKKNHTVFQEENISAKVRHSGIFIDIFPLDDVAKDHGAFFHIKGRIIKHLKGLLFLKENAKTAAGNIGIAKKLMLGLARPISTKRVFSWLTGIMKYGQNEDAPYYVNYGSQYGYQKQTMLKEIYDPAEVVQFEGYNFKAPKQTALFLKKIYGENYMALPPVEKRITHKPTRIQFEEE